MRSAVLALALCGALLAACNTVTIRPTGGARLATAPSYDARESFFLWGLAGTAHVDVRDVCGRRSARQMQTQTTFVDGLLGMLTIGIYAPHHARVWCE